MFIKSIGGVTFKNSEEELEAMRIEFVPGKDGPPELSLTLAGHVDSL